MTGRDILRLVRFPNTITAAADIVAGATVATWGLPSPEAWLLSASAAFLYAGAIALNDLHDLEQDRAGAPARPLPSGAVSARAALVVAIFAFGVGLAPIAFLPRAAALVTLSLFATILAYTFLPKRFQRLRALLIAGCRAQNFLRGGVVSGAMGPVLLVASALQGAWTLLISLISELENPEAGRRRGSRLDLFLALVGAAAGTAGLFASGDRSPWFLGFASAGGIGLAIWVGDPLRRAASGAGLAVRRAVFALPIWGALQVLSTGHWSSAALVASFYLAVLGSAACLRQRAA